MRDSQLKKEDGQAHFTLVEGPDKEPESGGLQCFGHSPSVQSWSWDERPGLGLQFCAVSVTSHTGHDHKGLSPQHPCSTRCGESNGDSSEQGPRGPEALALSLLSCVTRDRSFYLLGSQPRKLWNL